ncbi:hypothetical protein OPV22_019256 [Ensete ventricosum]|uniref:Uncharacterized protein n=1 Tax=Ensete ventricosum TaxID=4639 RepID=A0AAV8QGG5_ENSVE|nr:hypothetical protein OPV22_019256 [Ensete ventricosum]
MEAQMSGDGDSFAEATTPLHIMTLFGTYHSEMLLYLPQDYGVSVKRRELAHKTFSFLYNKYPMEDLLIPITIIW